MRRALALMALLLSATVVWLPQAASASAISALSVSPDQVRDGASSTGTVTTAFADTVPTTVLLFSSDPSVAAVPASVVVPAGSTAATFTITTNATAPETFVTITAAIANVPRTATLVVNQATPAGPSLTSVSVTPTSVIGGGAATGTVQFSAVTDGAAVQLSSSNPAVVRVPTSTTVNGGAASGAFPVSTSAVTATTAVTITASWFAVTRTTIITVTPGVAPAVDRVVITKARWKAGLLIVQATSTNFNAILSVFIGGGFAYVLTNNGGGRYSDQRGFVTRPDQITVSSNFGGSATAQVTT
jgi:hypothetical protein